MSYETVSAAELIERLKESNTAIIECTRSHNPQVAQVPDNEQRVRDWKNRLPKTSGGNNYPWEFKPKDQSVLKPKPHVFKWQTKAG
jgi:hypothetical protein